MGHGQACEGHGSELLANAAVSWMTGINRDIEGRTTHEIMRHGGLYPAYRDH